MQNGNGNGRVNVLYDTNYNIYDLFREEKTKPSNFNNEALTGNHCSNKISVIIFSTQNIDVLQDAIRYQVYVKTNKKYTIDRQSDVELKVIIRGTYMEHARHGVSDVLAEIRRLNSIILDFSVNKILREIGMYMTYKQDISKLPIPMDRGGFISSKGTKTLELKNF